MEREGLAFTMTTNRTGNGVTTSDIVREILKGLHDTSGLSWRKISNLSQYKGIPFGTLCAIANGADVPHKWKPHFGLPALVPTVACSACGRVHAIDRACEMVVTVRQKRKAPSPKKWRDAHTPQGTEFFDLPIYLLKTALENREEMRTE